MTADPKLPGRPVSAPRPSRLTAPAVAFAYLAVAILTGYLLERNGAYDWQHLLCAIVLTGALLRDGLRSEWVRR